MKKLGLVLLSVVFVMVVAGCSSSSGKTYDLVGTWVMTFDWSCDGTNGQVVSHFSKDGTWVNDNSHSGTWTVEKKEATIRYTSGTVYLGTFEDDDTLSGTVRSGSGATGCWSGIRTSTEP